MEVQIRKLADRIRLTITDNGKAFNVERTLHTRRGKRLGLLGMRERVEMVGGTFSIESNPDRGTIIQAEIFPVKMRTRKSGEPGIGVTKSGQQNPVKRP